MAEVRIIFTHHAETMLAQRNIERVWVERAIHEPDEIEADTETGSVRAYRTIAEHGGRVLRVVYTGNEDEIRVITVFFDRAKRR